MDGIMLHNIKKELAETLQGGFVTKIYQPNPALFNICFRKDKNNYRLFIILDSDLQGLFLSSQSIANPPTPSAFAMQLRKHLEGSFLQDIEQPGLERLLALNFGPLTLFAEFMGRNRNLVLVKDGLVLGVMRPKGKNSPRPLLSGGHYDFPPDQGKSQPAQFNIYQLKKTTKPTAPAWQLLFNNLEGAGPRTCQELIYRSALDPNLTVMELTDKDLAKIQKTVDWLACFLKDKQAQPTALFENTDTNCRGIFPFKPTGRQGFSSKIYPSFSLLLESTIFHKWQENSSAKSKNPLIKILQKEIKKKERKIQNLAEDFRRAKEYDTLRIKGELLTMYGHQLNKGLDKVSLPNIYAANENIEIKLKPELPPHANAQDYFKKYRKSKTAIKHLKRQEYLTLMELKSLRQSLHFLQEAASEEEISNIKNELANINLVREKKKKKPDKFLNKPLSFSTEEGFKVLVGRNNTQNDKLVRQAHPEDLWFHVKDIPGSHVILKSAGQGHTDSNILMAANLAAFFSSGRGSSKIQVDYTKAKNLKKPKGGPLGLVTYSNHKTIIIEPVKPEQFP